MKSLARSALCAATSYGVAFGRIMKSLARSALCAATSYGAAFGRIMKSLARSALCALITVSHPVGVTTRKSLGSLKSRLCLFMPSTDVLSTAKSHMLINQPPTATSRQTCGFPNQKTRLLSLSRRRLRSCVTSSGAHRRNRRRRSSTGGTAHHTPSTILVVSHHLTSHRLALILEHIS